MARFKYAWGVAILAGVVALGTPPPADAAFRLRVEDLGTGTGVVITDGGTGDTGALVGQITFNGTVGGFTVNVTTALSQPILGGPGIATIDLNSTNFAAGTGTLRITMEDTGFTVGNGPGIISSSVGGTNVAGGTLTFQSWVNPANSVPTFGADQFPAGALPAIVGNPPAGSTAAFQPAFVANTPGGFSHNESHGGFNISGPFSLFSQATLALASGGNVSFNFTTSVASPEPATIAGALAGLPVLGGFFWRRRKPALAL